MPNETANPAPGPTQAEKAIYREAKTGRETAERLLPLLSLLEDIESGSADSPSDQIIRVLESIVTGLKTVDQRTEAILAALSKRPALPAA
jgi:hypothetical protein